MKTAHRAASPLIAHNAPIGEAIGAEAAAEPPPVGYGLRGTGVQAGVWDEGHARESHVDLRGRVHARDLGGLSLHATHTTATLAGSGVGDPSARGVAVGADIWSFDWLLDAIEVEAAAPFLSVSSHAYGPTLGWSRSSACPELPMWWGGEGAREDPAFGRYGRDAAAVDALIRRTDLLLVWPAGNERLDAGAPAGAPHYHAGSCSERFDDAHLQELTLQFGTIGGAAVAKNALTIGAARAVARDALEARRIVPMDMSGFGPTRDGRIKPDVLAGGDAVRSASVEADDAYAVLAGTSSATAAAAGAIALLTELYRDTHGGADPRAAELRALLVHSARDAGAEPGPDYGAGYGLLDTSAAAALIAADAEASGEARSLWIAAVSDDAPVTLMTAEPVPDAAALRVTLAWSDPPAEPAGGTAGAEPLLVNDLDLVVTGDPEGRAVRFWPWSLDARAPSAQAVRDAPNRSDNLEVVDVAADDAGGRTFRVEVHAARTLWRARPQAFALLASVPLVPASASSLPPALDSPRYVQVTAEADEPSASIRVPLQNRGGGVLGFRARPLVPWIAVTPLQGEAPAELEVVIDLAAATGGELEALGGVEIDGDDPAGPRQLGVMFRRACEPDCSERRCGRDPRCGVSCGGCPDGESCADGECRALASTCPQADLGSELGAALASGDPRDGSASEVASCGGDGARASSFSWTAPESGRYAVTTRGSELDTVLSLRAEGCDGDELACNDDSGDVSSALAVELEAGAQVTAVVDRFASGGDGVFRLNIARAACPSAELGERVGPGLAHATTAGGIDELAGSCGGEGSEDVALAWNAPAAGRYRFALFDPRFQAVLYVREGGCDGRELGCSVAADVGPIEIDLEAGQTVTLVVDGREGKSGDFTLDVLSLAASCEGACGGSTAEGACFCDAECVAAGDCCADACEVCGQCRCPASCAGRECGDDGCGGTCGSCGSGEACEGGRCAPDPCAGVGCSPCSACTDGRCRPLPEGAACEDGDRCTVLDRCDDGRCAGEPKLCDDGFACTEDRCDARSGACEFVPDRDCCDRSACEDGGCERDDPRCPSSDVDAGSDAGAQPPRSRDGGDCGCRAVGAQRGGKAAGLWLAALLLALGVRLRCGRAHRLHSA